MQHFSILEPTHTGGQHPQEDYLATLDSPPTFVVADGVTLNFKKIAESGGDYPDPSPAGEVAKIFCETIIKSVSEKYETLDPRKMVEIFETANSAVGKYNQRVGRSEISGNHTGFYAATGAFVVIKNGQAHWVSICDSFVAHFDKTMNLKFVSTGLCTPYAVINGEKRMTTHLEKGTLDLADGDRLFVFTDGFEPYVKNTDFLQIFKNWDSGLKERAIAFSQKMSQQNPEKYAHERSLVAVAI